MELDPIQGFDPVVDKDEVTYPDGGLRAYSVIFGCFCGAVTTLGLVNSIGAIQAFVSTHQLTHLSTTKVSWIFSVYLSVTYSAGIVVGPIFDHKGARTILIIATILTFLGLMGAASSVALYQFILSFVCLGLGNGIALTPLVGVINHWFLTKRGFMTGIVTSGGSVGGLVFPLLLRYTFTKYNYVWGLRILAFICLALLTCSCILVRERIYRPRPRSQSISTNKWEQIEFIRIVRKVKAILAEHSDRTFLFTIIASFCAELSLVLLLTYFVTYVIAQGYSESTGYLLLTTWNGTSIFGRILPGLISDYLGKFNIHILMVLGLNLCCFIIWYRFGNNLPALYVFAGIGGFFSGSILGMIPACLAQITVVSKFGERYGILNFIISIGNLIGIPIGAVVIGNGSVQRYNDFVLLVASLSLAGTLLYYSARVTMVGLQMNVKV